jgi:5-methylcytosine-specific restriction endonuclease McrBC regulatory subunit McrC
LGESLARGTDRAPRPNSASGPTLIRVDRLDDEHASVTVVDSVGVVAIPGLQLEIRPKIPQSHLLHLVERSGVLPRFGLSATSVREDENLAHLIARWFVAALERVLEEGLSRGYRERMDELKAVRGRVMPLSTARLFYRGRLAVLSEYEDYDFDTPLNRLLLGAARVVAAGVPLPIDIRRRATRAIKRMDEVGEFRWSDLAAQAERPTAHYTDAATLAREVIGSSGRSLVSGAGRSWGFLFRTAGPVEAGIRSILKEGLTNEVAVAKKPFRLGNSKMKVNPDLVFGDVFAVGDVKYKLGENSWNRTDLYEVAAFAAAAELEQAVLANFRPLDSPALQPVQLGQIEVTELNWPTDVELEARDAAGIFADRVGSWIAAVIAQTARV